MNTNVGKSLWRGRLTPAIAAATLMIAGVGSAIAEETTSPYYGPHMWWGGGSWFFGPFSMLLFFGLAVAVVVLLVRGVGGAGQSNVGTAARSTALDILRERYARGEIDKAEFEERKGVLGA
jgi:putative membrane protein